MAVPPLGLKIAFPWLYPIVGGTAVNVVDLEDVG